MKSSPNPISNQKSSINEPIPCEKREEDVGVLERGLLQETLQVLFERTLLLLQHVETPPGEELRPRRQLGVLELGHWMEGRKLCLEVVKLRVSSLDSPV